MLNSISKSTIITAQAFILLHFPATLGLINKNVLSFAIIIIIGEEDEHLQFPLSVM